MAIVWLIQAILSTWHYFLVKNICHSTWEGIGTWLPSGSFSCYFKASQTKCKMGLFRYSSSNMKHFLNSFSKNVTHLLTFLFYPIFNLRAFFVVVCLFLRDSLLIRTKTEDMLSQLHTNLLGSMLTCKAAMRAMIQQQRGSIVNIGESSLWWIYNYLSTIKNI